MVTHPDIIIDGETNYIKGGGLIPMLWKNGYHWGGFSSQVSLFSRKNIHSRLDLTLEAKLIYAKATVPVAGGSFALSNFGYHLLAGISFVK